MDINSIEEIDGIRFSWNAWPNSRTEANKLVVPIGCIFTPLKESPIIKEDGTVGGLRSHVILPYEPVVCKSPCRAILNPYCQVDYRAKLWICPICLQRNTFPPHYAGISENSVPMELQATSTTIEYTLPKLSPIPPIFLFVIDTCFDMESIIGLKEALLKVTALLPSESLIGFITFGTMVFS